MIVFLGIVAACTSGEISNCTEGKALTTPPVDRAEFERLCELVGFRSALLLLLRCCYVFTSVIAFLPEIMSAVLQYLLTAIFLKK